jgi:DNA-binding NtrC family response regulator
MVPGGSKATRPDDLPAPDDTPVPVTETLSEPLHEVQGRIPVLVVAGGVRAGSKRGVLRLNKELEIGRGGPAIGQGVWMVEDELVSRRHARIVRGTHGFELQDLNSKNGTFVDGVRAKEPMPISSGSIVLVGAQLAVFRFISPDIRDVIAEEQSDPLTSAPTLSPQLAEMNRMLKRLAPSSEDLLLAGETGVGKEVYAFAVHGASGRKGRFVAVNCAAIPGELLEGELFGYMRGSHSQARRDKGGIVGEADGGTLFLDEISEMSSGLQAKLLRFLQSREVWPLGAARPRHLDIRIIAATNRIGEKDLALRPDLLMRLGAEPIVIPPLRDRIEDVPALCAYFLRDFLAAGGRLTASALHAFALHAWPGNVRELEKACLRAAHLVGPAGRIELRHLPNSLQRQPASGPASGGAAEERSRAAAEPVAPPPVEPPTFASSADRKHRRSRPTRSELYALLVYYSGDVPAVARALDRRREQIWNWCREMDLDPKAIRSG